MEPEETVTALKIRERVRSKKEGEEDRSWKDRRVEAEIREKGGSSVRKAREGRPKVGQWKRACAMSPRGGEGEPGGVGQKGQTREG